MSRFHRAVAAAFLFLGLVVTAAPALAQVTAQDVAATSVLETIKRRGSLQVGVSTFVPWAFRNRQGEIIGFEVDVARRLAEDLGVRLELVPTAWDGIIPALLARKFDTIIGGMSPTTKRNLTVNFTIPYATSGMGFAASKQLASGFRTHEDFNKPTVTLTCRRGTTACTDAQKFFPKATLRQFDDDAVIVQEVLNGKAHGFASSEPKPSFAVVENPNKLFLPFDRLLSTSYSGFAVRKGDPDILNIFDGWIRNNGDFLAERFAYWFKTRDWADQVAPNQ
jgi:polar amino acid transport system substrate-binding protein